MYLYDLFMLFLHTECDRIAKTKDMASLENDDVEPYIILVYKDGQYRANITWDFFLRGKRLPKIFLLNLTFYDIKVPTQAKYLNDTCVMLRLSGNRKVKAKGPVQFYFDCLPLLSEPDIGLVVRLWSYSRQTRLCRSLRSLPEKKGPCGLNVQCSKEYSCPISKNAHGYRQCKCYIKDHGFPKLNWSYDYTDERFYIHFTNMPSYLSYAEIDIVDTLSDTRLVDDIKVLLYNAAKSSEIRVNSSIFEPGEYTVHVCVKLKLYLKCNEPGVTESLYKNEIDDNCGRSNFYSYSDQTLNVSFIKAEKIISEKAEVWYDMKLETILGVVGAVIMTVSVTTAIFVLCQTGLRRNRRSPTTKIEMRELQREQQPLTESQPEDHEIRQIKNIEPTTPCKTKKYQVMLMYHPDNKNHTKRVAEFSNALTDKYGIIIERTTGNWYEFSESAFDKFLNVVLIISNGLYSVCHHYLYSEQIPQELLSERNQEKVPCIVLKKMQTLINNHLEGQCCSKRTNVVLHIVNLDKDDMDYVLQRFLNDHPFLKSEHAQFYHFCGTELHSEDLTPLVNNLKPTVHDGIPPNMRRELMSFNAESMSY